MGRKEKSDPIDAEVLALFGERIRPEIRPLPSEQAQRMRALVKRRRQLVEMIGAEENRLERADDSARSSIERHLDFLQEELAETEETLEETLRQSEAWKVQEQLLCSVPGLGKTTARTLLALLPELGPNWARPTARRSRNSLAWRRSSKRAAVGKGNVILRAGGLQCGTCSTWRL